MSAAASAVPPVMRAVVWPGEGRPLAVREVPTPGPAGPGEAVVRVRAAMLGAALVRAVTVGHPQLAPPAVLGTLVAGDVVAVGPDPTLRPGQLVAIDPHPPCGRCPDCRDGSGALCAARPRLDPGAHAEYVRLPADLADQARPVPVGVGPDAAVLTEIVACALDAVDVAGVGPGDDVVVVGCGPVGLVLAQAARRAGAERVVVLVNRDGRAELAARLGAAAVDVRAPDAEDRVRALTAGGRGGHVVVEAVGRAATYELALRLVRPEGTVVAFGGCPPGTTVGLDVNALHYRRVRLIGSYHYRPGAFDTALAALAGGAIDVAPIVSHRLALADVPGAVAEAAAGRGDRLAVLVRP